MILDAPLLLQFVAVLVVHWVADFVLQTDWQARNKSRRFDALVAHVTCYTAVLAAASLVLFGLDGLVFALVNGMFHFLTDALTSRWTARLRAQERWHNFFVIIGLDQLIHQATLAGALWLIFGWSP